MLDGLATDALVSLLRFLEPRDLCYLARVCKRLAEVSALDCLWGPICQRWVEKQPEAAGLGGVTLTDLQTALRVDSCKALYQAFHKLGAWPVGTWFASSEANWCMPRGLLMVVKHQGSRFVGSLVSAGTVHGPPIQQDTIWELDEWFIIDVGSQDTAGTSTRPSVALCWCFHGDGANTLSILLSGEGLVVSNGQGGSDGPGMPTARLLQGGQAGPHPLDRQVLHLSRLPCQQKPHLGVPRPAEGAAMEGSASATAAVLLKQLEGPHIAVYGPHGCEVLVLRMAGPLDLPPPGCPIAGLRLEAVKILGDPNVPALKFSFVVDASECRLGRYSPEDDPFPALGGFARPVLSFYESATVVLHLEERPVKAQFKAVGQINRMPGVWEPEFVSATLVMYDHQEFLLPFTVIFEDEGIQVRHAMDFQRLSLPQPGFDIGTGE